MRSARKELSAASSPGMQVRAAAVPSQQSVKKATETVVQTSTSTEAPVFVNEDGKRIEDGRYAAFMKEITEFIPESRQFTDPVRTFAYGTDASFYRLNPRLVVKVHTEEDMKKILPIAQKLGVPITFRAAGTSLSGQALTDSVLLKISHTGKNFRKFEVHGDGSTVTVEPGLIGGEVNRILATHHKKHNTPQQYKIGPDPSSIDSCMIGGIVSNNSSGMCCGVAQNTYHTLQDMRIVFVDGTVLDTADPVSIESFMATHSRLIEGVVDLAKRVQADKDLSALIRKKFAIKCTTGYSLNALVDFPTDNPIEIIKRLMIGSEGTLGFVSRATYNTVPEYPNKASAFIMFDSVLDACQGAAVLRRETSVDAVEMFDRASLRECESNEDMLRLVDGLVGCPEMAGSLLVECRGQTQEELDQRINEVKAALIKSGLKTTKPLEAYPFTKKEEEYKVYWDVRKGLIPIVGGAREAGTSMLIEDVACEVDKLGAMTIDLIEMFKKYEYHDASCFGHALEGNLHLVFSQGFRNEQEIQRFSDMMDEMCHIVAVKHGGSLKAEHGTGRNVAPYVEMEWGRRAYDLMWELKELFDPEYVLNPGVILNRDPDVHLKNLKPSPAADDLINRCIECGFCESNCPSKDLTLTPRQRITVYREIFRMEEMPNRSAEDDERLKEFKRIFEYQGKETCAADGMCQEKCPVKINTGDLIKSVRARELASAQQSGGAAMWLANNFSAFNSATPTLLNTVSFFHGILGPKPLEVISSKLNQWSNHMVPVWNPYMPTGAAAVREPKAVPAAAGGVERKVVYLPSCVTRTMGPSKGDSNTAPVHDKMMSLFEKAGYQVVMPEGLSTQCCGMMFNSRGFKDAASVKASALEQALVDASEGGKYPIVCDTSPCLATMKQTMTEPGLRFSMYEPVEFIDKFLKDKLEWTKTKSEVAVHVPCSSKKMGMEASMLRVAGMCADSVVPSGIPCCGMAGDRGMRYPELTGSSLQHLNLPSTCSDGYSTSRTCEMSLSNHSGVHFRGLVYLVDEATRAKTQ